MRVAVLSPVSHGTGATCVSLLLGLRLGQGTDRVCVTHVHPTDTSLRDAAGVSGTVDKTTTPSMIIRTFQSVSTMTEQEYAQYCAAVTRDVDLFTCTRAGDAACTPEDAVYLATYVAAKFPHKHVVIDVDVHAEDVQNEIISGCDVVVFTLRVSRNEINILRSKLEQYKKTGVLAGKKIAIVFNRWHGTVVKTKELAKMLGVNAKFVYALPFNEYVAWAEFNHKFPQMWQFVVKGDARVLPVRAELDRLINGVRQQKVSDAGGHKVSRMLGVRHVDLEEKEPVRQVAETATPQVSEQHSQMISAGLPAGFGAPAPAGFGAPVQAEPAQAAAQQQAAPATLQAVPAGGFPTVPASPTGAVSSDVTPQKPQGVVTPQVSPMQLPMQSPMQSPMQQSTKSPAVPAPSKPVQNASTVSVAPVQSKPVQAAQTAPVPAQKAPTPSQASASTSKTPVPQRVSESVLEASEANVPQTGAKKTGTPTTNVPQKQTEAKKPEAPQVSLAQTRGTKQVPVATPSAPAAPSLGKTIGSKPNNNGTGGVK